MVTCEVASLETDALTEGTPNCQVQELMSTDTVM